MITKKSFTGIIIGILAIFFITPMVFADESREMDHNEVLIRASDILGIKVTDLHDALKTAHKEVSAKNIKSRLQNLVEEGEISELDVEQITEWKNTQPEGIKSLKLLPNKEIILNNSNIIIALLKFLLSSIIFFLCNKVL